MRNYPQKGFKWIMELFFPIRCLACNKYGKYLCRNCLRTINISTEFNCIGCNIPSNYGATCENCRNKWHLDSLFICADYNNQIVSKLIHKMKYSYISECSKHLAEIAKEYIERFPKNTFNHSAVIPVPLSPSRLNWRGFNQAELIARSISKKIGAKMDADILIRNIMRKPQAQIKQKEDRLINITDSFSVRQKRKLPASVLLVDDVCTTGATLNECARVLKQNGSVKVDALVIARG